MTEILTPCLQVFGRLAVSELVEREYDSEVKIIERAGGNVWLRGLGVGIVVVVMWVIDQVLGEPWTKQDTAWGMVFVVGYPLVSRIWDRYKVAAEIRHQREVRVEVKLNELLDRVNIEDVE